MKNDHLLKVSLFIVCAVFVFRSHAQKKYKTQNVDTKAQKKRAPAKPKYYQRIMQLNSAFQKIKNDPDYESDLFIKKQKDKLNGILEDPDAKYVLAVMGMKGNKLHVDLVGSNKQGNGVSRNFNDSMEIKKSHKELKRKLKKIPFGLTDFPTVIKMERCGLERLRDATECQFYLLYFGVEDSWNKNSSSVDTPHFTISVLASEKGSDRVNGRHTGKNKSSSIIAGEETWSRENFTMYKETSCGIIIPDTEP